MNPETTQGISNEDEQENSGIIEIDGETPPEEGDGLPKSIIDELLASWKLAEETFD